MYLVSYVKKHYSIGSRRLVHSAVTRAASEEKYPVNSFLALKQKVLYHPITPNMLTKIWVYFQVVFVDVANKIIFKTEDHGRNISRIQLDFHPSETTFIEDDPYTLLAFDKIDPARKVRVLESVVRS